MVDYTPEVDTSYGLIYRLNYLWARADGEALTGNLTQWELILDRIFSNLLYRYEAEVKKIGKKVSVKFTDKSFSAWKRLKEVITEAKIKKANAVRQKRGSEFMQGKLLHYQSVMNYDIWLRKFMHNELKLYMKEVSDNPSGALFGGSFGKRKR